MFIFLIDWLFILANICDLSGSIGNSLLLVMFSICRHFPTVCITIAATYLQNYSSSLRLHSLALIFAQWVNAFVTDSLLKSEKDLFDRTNCDMAKQWWLHPLMDCAGRRRHWQDNLLLLLFVDLMNSTKVVSQLWTVVANGPYTQYNKRKDR